MQTCIFPTRSLNGTVELPASKPHMQRALTFALLSEGETSIRPPSWSTETRRLFEAAQQFGMKVRRNQPDALTLSGTAGRLRPAAKPLQTDGSAFMFRTVAALACAVAGETVLEGHNSIKQRPVLQYFSFIDDLGGGWQDESDETGVRLRITGSPAFGGETVVDTVQTSQFLTALLLVGPLARDGLTLKTAGAKRVGEGYIDLTLEMMRERGIDVEIADGRYRVPPGDYTVVPTEIPSDFTALSYLLAAIVAAPGSQLVVPDYRPSAMSSEREFFEAFAALGALSEYDAASRTLRLRHGPPLQRHVEIDGSNIPTVIPALCTAACFADADVTLRNAGHVNNHKCQRLLVMVDQLRRMGCLVEPLFNRDGAMEGLRAPGRSQPSGGVELDSFRDHRIYGGLLAASLGAHNPVILDGAETVDAGFPGFIEAMTDLGARCAFHRSPTALDKPVEAPLEEIRYATA